MYSKSESTKVSLWRAFLRHVSRIRAVRKRTTKVTDSWGIKKQHFWLVKCPNHSNKVTKQENLGRRLRGLWRYKTQHTFSPHFSLPLCLFPSYYVFDGVSSAVCDMHWSGLWCWESGVQWRKIKIINSPQMHSNYSNTLDLKFQGVESPDITFKCRE